MNKETKRKLIDLWNRLFNDIFENHHGWIYFFGRLFFNMVILYYILQFMTLFVAFVFGSFPEGYDYEHLGNTIVMAVGIIYLIFKIIVPIKNSDKEGYTK